MIKHFKGQVVVGHTPDGQAYTSPNPQTDPQNPNAQNLDAHEKARDRYTFTYRTNTDGNVVIDQIVGDGTRVQDAKLAESRGEIADMQVKQLETPSSVKIGGVEFAPGGPPEGVIYDEEKAMQSQEFFKGMESDYMVAQERAGVEQTQAARLNIAQRHREALDPSVEMESSGRDMVHDQEIDNTVDR